nr:hypothetical protein [Escherichia coli]
MENATGAAFSGSCFAHMFLLALSLILWITALPSLSELIPLAAAERPSVASQ